MSQNKTYCSTTGSLQLPNIVKTKPHFTVDTECMHFQPKTVDTECTHFQPTQTVNNALFCILGFEYVKGGSRIIGLVTLFIAIQCGIQSLAVISRQIRKSRATPTSRDVGDFTARCWTIQSLLTALWSIVRRPRAM